MVKMPSRKVDSSFEKSSSFSFIQGMHAEWNYIVFQSQLYPELIFRWCAAMLNITKSYNTEILLQRSVSSHCPKLPNAPCTTLASLQPGRTMQQLLALRGFAASKNTFKQTHLLSNVLKVPYAIGQFFSQKETEENKIFIIKINKATQCFLSDG